MAMASRIGAVLEAPTELAAHAFWFGEDQARYVITVHPNVVAEVLRAAEFAHIPARRLGATGGRVLALAGERPLPVDDLARRFEAWLPAYTAGSPA
jgi:phosphoribosylformylglycinamidine synthase